jgi:hypothetical protein
MRLTVIGMALLLGISGCNRITGPPSSGHEPDQPAPQENRVHPTRDEFIAYLDAKTISLSEPGSAPEKKEWTHVIKREEVEAVQFADTATSINNGPWSKDVTFLLKTAEGRYAVEAQISYRAVEGKTAFFGMEVKTVAKQ